MPSPALRFSILGALVVSACAGEGASESSRDSGIPGGTLSTTGGEAAGGSPATGGVVPLRGCTSTDTTYNQVAWFDDFDGPAGTAVDAGKWTYDVGGTGWGNSELEYYTEGTGNAALDGAGNLVITAKRESRGGKDYTSARLKTQGLYSFTYGRVEARIKLPKGQGIWPAFWMLGIDIATTNWPGCGEIDVMENIGKEPRVIHGTMHGPGYSAAAGPSGLASLSTPVSDAFHVFAVEWEPDAIRWFLDETLYATKTPSDLPAGAPWVFSHPFFLILNVAVGGGWPGNPDDTTVFPQTMAVDYVRVCQKG